MLATLLMRSTAARRVAPVVQRAIFCLPSGKSVARTAPGDSSSPSPSFANPTGSSFRRQSSAASNMDQSKQPGNRREKNVFQRVYDRYSPTQQSHKIELAEKMLQAVTYQASDPRWFGPGNLSGDDFRTFQALMTMHTWFLHKRLISETNPDPYMSQLVQEELFDVLWLDTTNRMRAHGVNEWLMDKNLKIVQKYSFMHCFHYDHCYTDLLDKPEERFEELKNLVCSHILLIKNSDDDKDADDETKPRLDPLPYAIKGGSRTLPKGVVSEDQVERIAWYIEAQYQNIVHDWPEEYFENAQVTWVDLPDFSNMKDTNGQVLSPKEVPDGYVLPKPWLRNIANDGVYYYWNRFTRKAQWERPI